MIADTDEGPDAELTHKHEAQAGMAAGLVLSTLYLTLEWLLQAPPPNRCMPI